MKFEDIYNGCTVGFKNWAYSNSEGHIVYSKGSYSFMVKDCDGDSKEIEDYEWEEYEGYLISEPTQEQKDHLKALQSRIDLLQEEINNIKQTAESAGLEVPLVLLDTQEDLDEWYSSNC